MNLSAPFSEVAMGLTRSIRLPSNETVTIRSAGFQGNINMNEVIVVKNGGIPIHQKEMKGSLLVHLTVYYPLLLTIAEREELKPRLGDAFEEVMLYLDFVSVRELDRFSTEVGYEWTREELIMSFVCQSHICSPCIMNLAIYYSFVRFMKQKERSRINYARTFSAFPVSPF